MSELSCIGASKLKVTFLSPSPSSIAIVYYNSNGIRAGDDFITSRKAGQLSYSWVEDIPRRSYLKIGTYVSGYYNPPRGDCGGTRYFLCNGVNEDAKDKDLELSRGEVPLLGLYSSADGITEVFKNARATTQEVYESWIANGVGYEGNSDWATLLKVNECLPDNAIQYYHTRALSAQFTQTFRKFFSQWNLLVYESGELIFTSRNLVGAGHNNWESPAERTTIDLVPRTYSNGLRTINKSQQETGVKKRTIFEEQRGRTSIYLDEFYPNDLNHVVASHYIVGFFGGFEDLELNIECLGLCPPNTCEVDCGEHICCYGSDGIAVSNFLK